VGYEEDLGEEMAPTSKFRERAAAIAARFVQNIVVIDDQAYDYFQRTESGGVQKLELVEPGLPPEDGTVRDKEDALLNKTLETMHARKDGSANLTPAQEEVEAVLATDEKPVVAAVENATDSQIEQGLNSRLLVANFARRGLVCGVIEPDPGKEDLRDLLAAAQRADILIVDWVFNDDRGKTAKQIVKSVLANDKPDRLRLIVVYTGDPAVEKIVEQLKNEAANGLQPTREKHVLVDQRTRIAVFSKVTSPKRKHAAVSLEELPDRVLLEFAALTAGLVTNAAMEGLALLRNKTHELLGRLHRRLDAPFLTHRALLPNPEDAQEFLTDLIGQEIAALLQSHEIGNVSDIAAIEEWFDAIRSKPPKHSKELAAAIGTQDDVRLELVRLGLQGFLDLKAAKEQHQDLERIIHRSGSKLFLDEAHRPDELDQEFAHVCSMVSRYASENAPRLSLGTVLGTATGAYFVCIQPVCDCVRLSGPRRFAFLEAEKNNAPNIVLKDEENHTKLRVASRVAALVQFTFAPEEGKDVVYATRVADAFQFASTDNTLFFWKGQLKFPQAQRLTQQFSSLLSRVGLDESEWLRRFERASDVEAVPDTPVAIATEPVAVADTSAEFIPKD